MPQNLAWAIGGGHQPDHRGASSSHTGNSCFQCGPLLRHPCLCYASVVQNLKIVPPPFSTCRLKNTFCGSNGAEWVTTGQFLQTGPRILSSWPTSSAYSKYLVFSSTLGTCPAGNDALVTGRVIDVGQNFNSPAVSLLSGRRQCKS